LVLLAVLVVGGSSGCERDPEPDTASRAPEPRASLPERDPDILWVTIDTLRPDHLSSYGYVRDTSPGLAAFAREGARFDSVTAQGPWTFSSVPSLITSRYPQAHADLLVEGHPEAVIASGSRSMARELSAAGYHTVFVAGHGAIGTISEICDGFETCIVEYEHADWVTDRALAEVRGGDDRPLFLWAYYIDPHVPYEAPDVLVGRYAGDGLVRTGIQADRSDIEFLGYGRIPGAAWVEGQRDLDWYIAAYDAEIRFTDEHIARLTRGLREMGRDGISMVFADHGESLSEHGLYLSHTVQLFDTILRIPWLARWPGHIPAGRVIDADVMALDIAPTLLGLLGRPAPPSWQGRDLSGCLLGRARCEPRPAYALQRAEVDRIAMRLRPYQITCEVTGAACELYDLESDPGQLHDVCAAQGARCAELRDRVLAWNAAQPARAFDAERTGALSEETRAALRALGYVQ
jgi:arylsulfatase A-like enzyme